MKLFTSVKLATFATAALAKCGLNLETLQAAGDENAVKAHVDAQVAAAKPDADAESALTEAAAENKNLTTALTAAKIGAENFAAFTKALGVVGITAESISDDKGAFSAEKFNAALDAHVKKGAVLQVAKKHGTGPVEHDVNPSAKADKPVGPDGKELTGLARTRAALAAEHAARVAKK